MRLFFLLNFFLLANCVFATDESTEPEEVSEPGIVSGISSGSEESRVLHQEFYQECETLLTNQSNTTPTGTDPLAEIRDCVNRKIADRTANQTQDEAPDSLEEAESTNLSNVQADQTQTEQGIERNLSERFEKLAHGDQPEGTNRLNSKRNRNMINQYRFYELYKAQLQKNIFIEYSKYCLENLYEENSNLKVPEPTCTQNNQKPWSGCTAGAARDYENISEVIYQANTSLPAATGTNRPQVTPLTPPLEPHPNGRSAAITKAISKEEFSRGAEYLKAKYQLCISAVSKMCRIYECANNTTLGGNAVECSGATPTPTPTPTSTPSAGAAPPAQNPTPTDSIQLADTENNSKGRIACSTRARIVEYRNKIDQTNDIMTKIDTHNDQNTTNTGFDLSTAYKGEFLREGSSEQASIDKITNIASTELISDEPDAIEERVQLLEACKQITDLDSVPDECKGVVLNQETQNTAIIEFETATAEEEHRLRTLFQSEELLKEYLSENGMQIYLDRLNEQTISQDELSKIITSRFRTERTATIERLRNEFNNGRITSDDISEPTSVEARVNEAQMQLREEKDRIGNIIQYNNIISSFLETTQVDEQGNPIQNSDPSQSTRNVGAFIAERDAIQEGSDSSNPTQNDMQFFSDLGSDIDESQADRPTELNVENVDSILGRRQREDTPGTQGSGSTDTNYAH